VCQIEIFNSPGGLMPGVMIEKMKEGFSKVRNHGIANAFVYMNLIEQWGSGIPKILAQTKEYGLPEVEFIDMENALRVNMYRALPEDEKQAIKASDKKQAISDNSKRQTIKTSDSRTMFAEYMSQHGASTTAEIAKFSGLSPQRTRTILSKKNAGVDVTIFTYASAPLTNKDVENFNAQYPKLTVKKTQVFH
jgi:predicted HTH transcriptional regulator